MPHRRFAVPLVALLILALASACGDDEASDVATAPSVTGAVATTSTAPASSPTTVPTDTPTTAPEPSTPGTTSPPVTSPPATSPPATSPPVTAAPGRTAALGESFSLGVGETVTIPSEGLSVTFGNVGPDNRCPPGVMCIVAGNASIGVPVTKSGSATAILVLNTDDVPMSGSYGPYTVHLVRLSRGSPPVATLMVA